MKLSKKFFTLSLTALAAFSLGASLLVKSAPKKETAVSAVEGYTTYYNDDLGFATRDPNETHIVKGDADGGMQTKGNVLSEKSELVLRFKKTLDNYWIGVGGYAVYVSGSTSVRFLYLGYNSSSAYSRNAEKTGLVMKTYDGSAELTAVAAMSGALFNDYSGAVLRFDFSNPSAVKAHFHIEYGGVKYYPFESSTRIDEVTYTHQPSGFSSSDQLRAMAGANATDSGVSILKFNTQETSLSSVISRGSRTFEYKHIGDFALTFNLSQPINAYNGYLNDHLNEWLDGSENPINIGDGILINGKTLRYWVNFTDPYLAIDSSSEHGIHDFPMYIGGVYAPIFIHVSPSAMKFVFNTAFIPSDSVIITFKAGLFKGYYDGVNFTLASDLVFKATLKAGDYGTIGSNVTFENAPTETVGNYEITTAADWGEQTAAGGAKYRKFAVYTNIPRDKTNINQAFPYDHYRYMFDNVMFNGKSLTFYNVWGRGNNKDYTDLTTPVANPDYELEHPAGITAPNYNMVTYLQVVTDQDNYVFFIDIPNKLMEDFGYSTYNFSIRDGSAWVTPSGVIRYNMAPADRYAVTNFVDDNMHLADVGTDNTADTGACRGDTGYYLTAKKAFNGLTAGQKAIFQNNTNTELFAIARARYEAWAAANHDGAPYDGNNTIVTLSSNGRLSMLFENNGGRATVMIVIVMSLVSLTGIGFLFSVKKRKHN